MITFSTLPAVACLTAAMSARNRSRSPSRRAPTSITMSISSAPSAMARTASSALAAAPEAPSGNPTTTQVFTALFFRRPATKPACTALTQTEAKP